MLNNKLESYRARCRGLVKQILHQVKSLQPMWESIQILNEQREIESSFHHLNQCNYYITDPHMSNDGVRHKMMKIIKNNIHYEAAVSHSPKSEIEKIEDNEEKSIFNSLRYMSMKTPAYD
jgi:hypothetical protein